MAQLERGKLCPLLKKDCVQLQCSWYTQVRGTHPQTGQEVDEWACAIAWAPILLINNTQQVRQGAAATEGLRNQIVQSTEIALKTQVMLAGLQRPPASLLSSETKEIG